MKKTIMMMLSSVIALSCANFDTYATDTAQPERKRDKARKVASSIKTSLINTFRRGKGQVETEAEVVAKRVDNQINAQLDEAISKASNAELKSNIKALSTCVNNLITKCRVTEDDTHSRIIAEANRLSENINNKQYEAAVTNADEIVSLSNGTNDQPIIQDATSIQQYCNTILNQTKATPAS